MMAWGTLLVYETFGDQVTENGKAVCAKENTNLALTTSRLTSSLQPIGLGSGVRMQWMTDVIHDFTMTDYQKNPLEEFIVLWTVGVQSDIFKKMMESFFCKHTKNRNLSC